MAKYAQMLAGMHWHPPPTSDAEAAAAGAGGRASVADPPRNAWQVLIVFGKIMRISLFASILHPAPTASSMATYDAVVRSGDTEKAHVNL